MNKLISKMPFLKNIKDIFNEPEICEEDFRSSKMMSVLFENQSTEQVIKTLNLFDEKVNLTLIDIRKKASSDKDLTEYYLEKFNK